MNYHLPKLLNSNQFSSVEEEAAYLRSVSEFLLEKLEDVIRHPFSGRLNRVHIESQLVLNPLPRK